MFYIRYVVSPKFVLYLKFFEFVAICPEYYFTNNIDDCCEYKSRDECFEVIRLLYKFVDSVFENCEVIEK